MEVSGKNFVVTGGGSGLGAANARMLAGAGANVVIADLNEKAGAEVARALGQRAAFIRTDVTDEAQVQAAVDLAVSRWGGVHGGVNCAGIALMEKLVGRERPHRSESFQRCIAVHVFGTFYACRAVAAQIAKQPRQGDGTQGVIVNTSSVAALDGAAGVSAYAAAKAAIAGMTLPLARELSRHAIRVVAIAPGVFETPMAETISDKAFEMTMNLVAYPKRKGDPAEHAQLVRQIIENEMFNGTVVRLDAGIRLV